MVLNESELFTLHTPCLLMNTSILFWKIVLQSCGIFFNAVSSKLEAGKPLNAKTTSITSRCSSPPSQPRPGSHSPPAPRPQHLFLNLCGSAEATQGCLPRPPWRSLRVKLEAGGLKLRRVRALSSVWKGTKRWAKVPRELKSSAGCLIGCVASTKG